LKNLHDIVQEINDFAESQTCDKYSLESLGEMLKLPNQFELGDLNEPENIAYIIDLLVAFSQGVIDLHRANLLHRDLKPENFFAEFVDEKLVNIKLGDLELMMP